MLLSCLVHAMGVFRATPSDPHESQIEGVISYVGQIRQMRCDTQESGVILFQHITLHLDNGKKTAFSVFDKFQVEKSDIKVGNRVAVTLTSINDEDFGLSFAAKKVTLLKESGDVIKFRSKKKRKLKTASEERRLSGP